MTVFCLTFDNNYTYKACVSECVRVYYTHLSASLLYYTPICFLTLLHIYLLPYSITHQSATLLYYTYICFLTLLHIYLLPYSITHLYASLLYYTYICFLTLLHIYLLPYSITHLSASLLYYSYIISPFIHKSPISIFHRQIYIDSCYSMTIQYSPCINPFL